MPFREQRKGRAAAFLLPSLKLKQRNEHGESLEETVHHFLLDQFGGYTAASGNLFGYWRSDSGQTDYGEHKEYRVALQSEAGIVPLKEFLAHLARQLDEQSLYLEIGQEVSFISPA